MPKTRIRPAKHYQRPDNAVRQLSLAGRRRVSKDLREAFSHLSELVPHDRVRNAVADGKWREIADHIDLKHFKEVLKKTFMRLAKVYEQGAQLGVRKINGAFHQARRRVRFRKSQDTENVILFEKAADVYNFDMYDKDTLTALRDAQDALIQQLTTDVRDTIEQIVTTGALQGLGPEAIVSDIRSLIGLTDTQSAAVMNYRNMLENLDGGALTRALRNDAMDSFVRDAITNEQALSKDVIDKMVDDYTSNYLDYRAATIAQTESVRAANKGLHDSYSQAVERGVVPEEAITREWELGDMPCPICESIPDNNPDGVGVNESFDSDDGEVDDPPVHPNCMCSVNYITDISQVPEDEDEEGPDIETPPEDEGGPIDFGGFAVPEDILPDIEETESAQEALLADMAAKEVDTSLFEESQAQFEARAISQAEAEAQAVKDIEAEQAALEEKLAAQERALALEAQNFSPTTYDANLEAKLKAQIKETKTEIAEIKQVVATGTAELETVSIDNVIPRLLKLASENESGTASVRLADGTIIRTAIQKSGAGYADRRNFYVNGKRMSAKQLRDVLSKKYTTGATEAGVSRKTYTAADFRSENRMARGEMKEALNHPERNALSDYKNGGYRFMNRQLREGRGGGSKDVQYMDSAVAKGKISKGGLVFRGVSALRSSDYVSLVGQVMDMKSFISTAWNFSFAQSWSSGGVVFRIMVEEGQTALEYAKAAGRSDSEYEIILPRTARFMVHSVEGRYVNLIYLGS